MGRIRKNGNGVNFKTKLLNIKTTGGLTKILNISCQIQPLENRVYLECDIKEIERNILSLVRDNINRDVFCDKTMLFDKCIKLNRLQINKKTLCNFELYLVLNNKNLLNKRSVVVGELERLSKLIIDNVLIPNKKFIFN
jgi:hypothetical protein